MAEDPENPPLSAETKFQRRKGDRNVVIKGHDIKCIPEEGEHQYGNFNNMVITSSYTIFTFIPLNLFEQFSNLANLYFLMIGILQIIPWISTTKGVPTMYQPLAFIVLVSALRAASEDWAKHKSDAKRNDYRYEVWSEGGFQPVRSGDLKVGHIVRVKKNEMIPADLLFIASALNKGHCFIDKANLNGETTLEVLSSIKETRRYVPWDSWPQDDVPGTEHSKPEEKIKLKDFHAEVHYEPPNKKFDKLRGTLLLYPHGSSNYQELNADGKVLLMRETTLRNCAWILGIVLYNGNDTKIQKSNSEGGKPKVKKSKIMRLVNKYLMGMLALQIGFCLFGGIYAGVWIERHLDLWYFGKFPSWETPALDGFLAFFSWFILLSQMVPISLIVSSEIVKTIQSYFMQWDFTLYYAPIDKPTKVNSSTHHEDLGLVDYVFSDKTGTLTQNKMTFRYALLTDGEFGSKETEIARSVKLKAQELADRTNGVVRPRDVAPWTARVAPLLPDPLDRYKFEVVFMNIKTSTTNRIYAQEATVNAARRIWRTYLEKAGTLISVHLSTQTSGPGQGQIHADFKLAIITSTNKIVIERKETNYLFAEGAGVGTAQIELKELEAQGAYHAETDSLHALVEWVPEEDQNCCERNSYFRKIWVDEEAEARRRERLSKSSRSGFPVNEFTEEQRLSLLKTLWGKDSDPKLRRHLHLYMCHMALSNTVKPYEEKVGDRKELKFQSESAEESAMIQFAQSCGFTKKTTNPTRLQIKEYGNENYSHPIKEYTEEYEHLATFGFTSARARVTVIYRSKAENHIHVMVKGQDTVLLPLLTKSPNEDELLNNLKTMANNGLRTLVCAYSILENSWWLERRAKYEEAIKRDETEASENHPDKCKKSPACEKCYTHDLFTQYEKDAKLQYLGCLGLEDQLQLLVPETIHDCLRAGVKVWMITGDKLDTAKNIGLATNLIDSDMQVQFSPNEPVEESIKKIRQSRLLEITGQWAEIGQSSEQIRSLFDMFDRDKDGTLDRTELKEILEQLGLPDTVLSQTNDMMESLDKDGDGALDKEEFVQFISSTRMSSYDAIKYDVDEAEKIYNSIENHQTHPVSILVSRRAFEVMFPGKGGGEDGTHDKPVAEEELEKLRVKFFDLARKSKSVVFARAQPAMKKKMVTEIMARDPEATTLAIGDGANDTDMITAAHLGVGIAGVEGTAATNSADYAVGTFRMLHTLLFVHGFWSYQRIADLVNFIFYKAALVAMTGYYFGFYSGFSGQQFYNDPIYQLYNVVFTALPIIIVAVFDQKLPRHTLENNPAAFREAKNKAFSSLVFFGWILRAFIHSLILFFLPVYAIGYNEMHGTTWGHSNGLVHGLWFTSTVVYFGVVLVPTFLILFVMLSITFFHAMSIFISILALFIMCYMWSYFVSLNSDLKGVMEEVYGDPMAWLTMIIAVLTPLILEMIWRGIKRDLRPSLTEILQERIRIRKETAKEKKKSPKTVEEDASENDLVPTGPVRGQIKRSSVSVPDENLTHEDESKFYSRKAHRAKNEGKTPEGHLQHAQSYSDGLLSKDENLKRSVIRAMLRFRNMTGSTFDSAAQAKYQAHDTMSTDTKEGKREVTGSGDEYESPTGDGDEASGDRKERRKFSKEKRKTSGATSREGDT